MRSSPPERTAVHGGLIADRYRVQAQLGRGGMARVYRVIDERSGDALALKQLSASGPSSATLQAMFEREYHTLAQLAHPHVVRAFEYGLGPDGPYYTMELLQGADVHTTLRRERPAVAASCVLLRDIASALVLIHSRRLVHRDVGPRNVWVLPDGRAKLIDFGTLVAMGPQTRAAGTAPFMPPEAVHTQPLDGRCDLYALGALAYLMLTGCHAYPARDPSELVQLWRRPPRRPDELDPSVPGALADLVMSMLSLDPRGRPASAAEVCERLGAICELPADGERHEAQAFLSSPQLVGREAASHALRKRLLRAMRGRGGTVAIVAPSGFGRSRMLESVVVEAKLLGAAAIRVDASAVGSGAFAVASAIVERLLELLPMAGAAAAAVEIAPLLGHLSPNVHRALGEPPLEPVTRFDRTHRLTAAIVRLVEAAAYDQRLVIAVDDVHRADGASAGVLAQLSLLTGRKLLLVSACDAGVLSQLPPALEQLCRPDRRVDLAPFASEDTRALLASLFGDIPELDDAADWLHELSQGSPQTCLQYAQYLVDEGIARYEAGRWRLRGRIRDHALPPTLSAMLSARLGKLGDDARTLGLCLAVARDDTRAAWQPEIHIRIEDFATLIDGDGARVSRALDELLQAGFLEQRDGYYVARRATTSALLGSASEEALGRAHARVAEVLLQEGYRSGALAVRHLQCAGEHQRARALIARQAAEAVSGEGGYDWDALRLSVATEAALHALAHYRAHPGSPEEGIQLRRFVMATCAVYDWGNARAGDEQIAQLRADCGLHYWDETDPALPQVARVLQCLERAKKAYDDAPEAERGFSPFDAVKELCGASVGLSAAFLHMHDVARARWMSAVVEPLKALAPVTSLFGEIVEQATERACGRELEDRTLHICEQLEQATTLPDVLRTGLSLILLHQQAVEDARRGRLRALELLDRLASRDSDDVFFVVHGRWLAHAFGGKARLAEPPRRRLDVITEDDVWRRKAFLFVEAQLHALTGDLPSLRRTSEAIAELAEAFEGFRPWLGFCRAELHRLRGELDAAHDELQAALAAAPPGEHRAWVLLAPAQAELRLARGDAEGAHVEACAILEQVQALSLDRSAALAAERVRSLAESRRGDHAAARASLARAFELAHELGCDGLLLARLYEANAAVALAAGEASACAVALERLCRLLEHAEAPALFRAYDALREAAGRALGEANLPPAMPVACEVARSSDTSTHVQARLTELDSQKQRANHALQLMLDDVGAGAGCLLLFDGGGRFVAATVGREPPSSALLAAVDDYLQAELRETETAVVTVADLAGGTPASGALTDAGVQWTPVLLQDASESGSVIAGVALLSFDSGLSRAPRRELTRAIARCLLRAGDSIGLAAEHD